MDGLTAELFARINFVTSYKFLSKYEDIKHQTVKAVIDNQEERIEILRKKIDDYTFYCPKE